jgi:putative membrane protein
MRSALMTLGVAVLAAAWFGPLPALARSSFAAHMTMHMAVVAVAAPLIAVALAGSAGDPSRAMPRVFAAIPASLVEFVIVWTWHAPAWHHAARSETWPLVLEQASFLGAGLLLWIAAVGGDRTQQQSRRAAGVVALLFTSMHMTLLGALFALASRPLFQPHDVMLQGSQALTDQQIGGIIMLLVGGVSYLIGGVTLTAAVLRPSLRVRRQDPVSAASAAARREASSS